MTDFIILWGSTVHKKNITVLTFKNKREIKASKAKKEQPIYTLELFSYFRSPRSIDITIIDYSIFYIHQVFECTQKIPEL